MAPLAELAVQPFLLYALGAGTCIALATGLVGWFIVLRGQLFVGDALSHVSFTGALAALAAGVDPRLGLFVAAIVVGVSLAGLGERGQPDDVATGTVFAWVLGLGVFFLALFTTTASGGNGAAAARVLFGSIFGLSPAGALLAAAVGLGLAAALLAMARPLLFASIDPAVAAVQGVPVRLLGVLFLALVGACAAEAAQAVGALLLLGLLAAPAGAAHILTGRPFVGLALSAALSVTSMWLGLLAAAVVPAAPPSFTIMALAALLYGLAVAAGKVRLLRPSFSSV
ncbi:MAG: metal ABC transporter permease [Chloroflexota bacterium]